MCLFFLQRRNDNLLPGPPLHSDLPCYLPSPHGPLPLQAEPPQDKLAGSADSGHSSRGGDSHGTPSSYSGLLNPASLYQVLLITRWQWCQEWGPQSIQNTKQEDQRGQWVCSFVKWHHNSSGGRHQWKLIDVEQRVSWMSNNSVEICFVYNENSFWEKIC